ncbi:MAG: hypothetical protein JSS07_11295 [Proteobacteria bacterium]|nr:hypothetical protein [Pseudomonadota bacterium]
MLSATLTQIAEIECYSITSSPLQNSSLTNMQSISLATIASIEAEIDQAEGVTHYLNEKGELISFENYWHAKAIESQPFYILGKALRKSVEVSANSIINMFSYCTSVISNTKEYLTQYLQKVITKVKYLSEKDSGKPKDRISQIKLIENALLHDQLPKILNDYPLEMKHKIINEHMAFNKNIDLVMQLLSEKIEAGRLKARLNNKPLMILVGEGHYSYNSAVVNALTLLLAKQKLGIKSFFTERVKFEYKEAHTGLISKMLLLLKEKLDIKQIFIDCGYLSLFESKCEEYEQLQEFDTVFSIRYRNKIMAKMMVAFEPKEDSVAIVGDYHLYGLAIEETALREHYEIVSISGSGICTILEYVLATQGMDEELKNYLHQCISYRCGGEVVRAITSITEESKESASDELVEFRTTQVMQAFERYKKLKTKKSCVDDLKQNDLNQKPAQKVAA